MKRDMDLVRRILITTEDNPAGEPMHPDQAMPDVDENVLMEHIGILEQAGLLKVMPAHTAQQDYYIIESLTWKGHEFLDSIKNDNVWDKVKQTVAEKGGVVSFAILQELALKTSKIYFGLGD